MKIFIDPGHGGSDSGAVANGIIEKKINLTVSLRLKELLEKAGLEVAISRDSDVDVGLSERCKMANQWKADYFISVHHNAGGGDGYEVIHSIYAGEGKALAAEIGTEFGKIGQNCRRIFSLKGQNGDYYCVIRETNMPAIITEFAFLDTVDYQAVDTDGELLQEAEAIYKAVVSFLNWNIPTPRHWAQQDHDELKAAGFLLSDHSAMLNQPASEGMVVALANRLRKEFLKG